MTFKIQLTKDQSEKVVAIMREKSQYRHILIESVEFTTLHIITLSFDPKANTIKVPCFKVKGVEEWCSGTTYVYSNDKVYNKLQLWFQPLLREHKLQEIGI